MCPSPASGQTLTLPTSVGPAIDIDPVLIPDDPESDRRRSMQILFSIVSPGPKADPKSSFYESVYGDSVEGSLDPFEYQLDLDIDWVQDLGDASRQDTSPDAGMLSLHTVATEEGASYSMVVRKTAEVLDLELSSVQDRTNLLTEVLQPGSSRSEPLLPFIEHLTDVLLGTWPKPSTGAPVNRADRPKFPDPTFYA
ncbi:hypothetical protein NDU88_002890 [Pleurodeles waltl]|uniref:Uncharacterized protein n=1 Tax=Pleurodeles waltl TaxID=8319 RepID=A0AAV7TPE6_PLEWA|nr:hypothetical protein NDU88_002890 [Pleurodeles waltl]